MLERHKQESEPFMSDDGIDLERIPTRLFVLLFLSYTIVIFGAGLCFSALLRSSNPPPPIEQVK